MTAEELEERLKDILERDMYHKETFEEALQELKDIIKSQSKAYHKAKVESITDKEIYLENKKQNDYPNGMEGTYEQGKFVGFDNGADWLKSQLLK